MKKRIFSMLLLVTFCFVQIFAVGAPEDLFADNAQLFLGKVQFYETNGGITIVPTEVIRGDVKVGIAASYDENAFIGKEGFAPQTNAVYLMAFYDANNPLYVFQISGTDPATMKLEGAAGVAMWERLEAYLNAGEYSEEVLADNAGGSSVSIVVIGCVALFALIVLIFGFLFKRAR